jgi:FMN phosphatase YigB (HAD superfamily)
VVGAVFLDVGETILDETRHWAAWADWLGVSTFTLFGVLGSCIEQGLHHREAFQRIRPGIDLERARCELRAAGNDIPGAAADLYADAGPCLESLRAAGLHVGLAGNQPESIEPALAGMGLAVDVIASSARWRVEKPSPDFFAKVVEAAGMPAERIAYVGDRLDNDVLPALDAGLVAVFMRRGPWGFVHAARPEVSRAHLRIDSLDELLPGLRAM